MQIHRQTYILFILAVLFVGTILYFKNIEVFPAEDFFVPKQGFSNIIEGITHDCIIRDDNAVYCSGFNGYGQLGDGTRESRDTPVRVLRGEAVDDTIYLGDGPNKVSQMVATSHSCALKTNGSVYCWGDNFFGALGDGTKTNKYIPTRVLRGESPDDTTYLGDGPNKVLQIDVGSAYTCALKTDGSVYCWGHDLFDELGIGGRRGGAPTPARVLKGESPDDITYLGDGPNKVFRIDIGERHTCALKTDGSVYCWGSGYWGELGSDNNKSATPSRALKGESPDDVTYLGDGPNKVLEIAAALSHTCALKTDGSVYCWGVYEKKQSDEFPEKEYAPVRILKGDSFDDITYLGDGSNKISKIVASRSYSCALKTDGAVYCWGGGSNDKEWGSGYRDTPLPSRVLRGESPDDTTYLGDGPNKVSRISAGFSLACAIKTDSSVYCWRVYIDEQISKYSAIKELHIKEIKPFRVRDFTNSNDDYLRLTP